MSSNHLIIGLGGTGGKIIRAFRKTIFQEFRKDTPDGVQIGYLYVDSSAEMMGIDDPTWKILGSSVQLGKASQLLIKGMNLQGVLDNVQNYPGIKNWIGDRTLWKDILNSIVGEVLGGQKRRLGRFLFANNADKFNGQIQELVRQIQKGANIADVTFHICCGLAGGTGSGSLIDIISQTRSLYNDPQKYRILVYALLPDTHPPQGWDTGNYHANGYAALSELNAMSVGRYAPYDVTGIKERHQIQDPFNGCYVFTNENENGMIVDVNKDLPNVVADFLYQKVVAIKDISDWTSLKRMENAENGDGTPETAPGTNLPERSKRFLTFGIKRLIIPEEEIMEYLTYDFTRQASLQLLYNNWQDTLGFNDEAKNLDFNELVHQQDVLNRWKLSNDHLCLSLGILSEDINNRKWKPVANEWQDVMPNFKILIRESSDKKTWLDELGKICAKRFVEEYRGLGVKNFYKAKLKAKKDIAREIRKGIETELFDEWRNGVKSLHEIGKLLEALIISTEDRLKSVDEKLGKLKDQETFLSDKITANYREWANIGLLDKALGKQDKLFDSQAVFMQDIYICRTWIEGWQFAKELLQETLTELTDFKSEIDKCINTSKKAIEKFEAKLSERCADDGATDLKKHIIRFYEPDLVRKISTRFVKDETVQRTQTNQVRAALVARLGENPGFKAINERITPTVFMDMLEHECEQSARRTHDNLIQNSKEKLLGVSIIEKLKDRYAGDSHALQSYIEELVKYAGNYASFTSMEKQKKGPGISNSPTGVSKFTVIMPKAPEHADFVSDLKNALRKGHPSEVEIVETGIRPHEITLISISNLFPLRFLSTLPFLKDKYEQRINGSNAVRAKLELHTEGDGKQFPNLFVPSMDDVVKEGMPYILLAKSMGILKSQKNPTTGAEELLMIVKDSDGFESALGLGKSVVEVTDTLDAQKANALKGEVETLLKSEYLHSDKRAELIKLIQADLKTIQDAYGFGDLYNRFLDGAKKAAQILK